jgi:uncharacterized membrane protein YqjE
MALERLRNATLPRVLSDVLSDLTDLAQKEMRLAKAEVSENISRKLAGGIWLGVAAILALVALFILLQAVIFAIASYGVSTHWACLMVAGVVAMVAAGAFFKGRTDAQADLVPDRAINQVKRDIATVKEHWT